jgi:transcription initiation factor TFIIIB Brf1 subunit/transcription initiation factor TFIIB
MIETNSLDYGPEWYGDAAARASIPGRLDEFIPGSNGAIVPDSKKRFAEADKNKSTRLGLKVVERFGGFLGLDRDHVMCCLAKRFYTDYAEARKSQGRPIREAERATVAACALYFGCKSDPDATYRNARTIKEIASHCRVGVQDCADVAKSFKALLAGKSYAPQLYMTVTAIDVLMRAMASMYPPLTSTPETLAKKATVVRAAHRIFGVVKDKDLLEGRTPETVCSAVLYLAFEETGVRASKKEVYTACAVSNVTLNKALQDLRAAM